MTGFYEPDCGAVELNGYDVNRKRLEALSRVAYVPESGALYPEMTVYEYLRFMAGLRRISHQDLWTIWYPCPSSWSWTKSSTGNAKLFPKDTNAASA